MSDDTRRQIPEKVVAVGAERWLFEESSDELMTHRFMDLRVLDGAASLSNAAAERCCICIHRTSQLH